MTHETIPPSNRFTRHEFFDGFVPNTPETEEVLSQQSLFQVQEATYEAHKESIDITFQNQYIAMDAKGKIIANSPDMVTIRKIARDHFSQNKTAPLWTPKIPYSNMPRQISPTLIVERR